MSPFKDRVVTIVRMVPYGKVASYGQVALYAGLPRAAREVGWILNQSEGKDDLPWWRVINNKGLISISGTKVSDPRSLQKKLLEAEEIEVSDEFEVDMEKYRWQIAPEQAKQLQLSDAYIRLIIEKYNM
ncbi:MAG: MGMT family protein [Candidatus Levybacteria bacterium]|nr:MGMT family protein [Candidatus Levybacteria bacterium]